MNKNMIKEFQCAGCVAGSNTECGSFKEHVGSSSGFRCVNHCAGTMIGMVGLIYLGLPKGFCRVGKDQKCCEVWLYEKNNFDFFNFCTLPIWAMEEDGYLFIRCYMPRVNMATVQVIKDGKFDELEKYCQEHNLPVPQNVANFIDDID
jgi:hypothetical protein